MTDTRADHSPAPDGVPPSSTAPAGGGAPEIAPVEGGAPHGAPPPPGPTTDPYAVGPSGAVPGPYAAPPTDSPAGPHAGPGQDPYPSPPDGPRRTEGWAITVLVLGITGLIFFTPLPGIAALVMSRWAVLGGKRTAGIVLGWVQIAMAVAAVIALVSVLSAAHYALQNPSQRPAYDNEGTVSGSSQTSTPSDGYTTPTPGTSSVPAGMIAVDPGPDVDGICDAAYVAAHPDAPTSVDDAAGNPDRVAWLPGQTDLYADNSHAYDTREVYATGAAWHWTCGRPDQGTPVTQEQFTWSCQQQHPGVDGIRAWLGDADNAYSWKCIGPN